MQLIDEILEYLQYHPMFSRQDVEGCLVKIVSYNSSVGRLAKGPGNVVKRLADIADMGVDVRNLPSEDETAAREINCVVEDA